MRTWRQRSVGVMAIVGLAVLVAACGGAAATPSPAADRLSGTTWALTSVDDQAVPADVVVTLAFAAGTASGSSGCNTYTGPYTVDGQSLDFGALASTRMACAGAAMALEQAYLAALDGVTTWAVPQDVAMGTELTLTGSGPKLRVRAARRVLTRPASRLQAALPERAARFAPAGGRGARAEA